MSIEQIKKDAESERYYLEQAYFWIRRKKQAQERVESALDAARFYRDRIAENEKQPSGKSSLRVISGEAKHD